MPAKDPNYHRDYRQRNLLKTRDQTAARVAKYREKWKTVPAHLDAAKSNQAGDYYSPAQFSLDNQVYLDWLAAEQPAPWEEDFEDYQEDDDQGPPHPFEGWPPDEPQFVQRVAHAIFKGWSRAELVAAWTRPVVRRAIRRLVRRGRLSVEYHDGRERFLIYRHNQIYRKGGISP